MAFPTSNPLAAALISAQGTAATLKYLAQSTATACAAGPVSANLLLQMMDTLVRSKAIFNTVAATPGILQYAKDQYNNQSLSISTQFTNMISAIDAAATQIAGDIPKGTAGQGGWMLTQKFAADGSVSVRAFSSVETAAIVTALNALVATIS